MIYFQKEADQRLSQIIKSFWLIDGENNSTINQEKIIPDGYPEMIFHYRKPYRSNINGDWILQKKYIIAGQIRNHFFLENTGELGMFAIKFQPWALKLLFGIDMHSISDKVIPIDDKLTNVLAPIKNTATASITFEAKVNAIEDWFLCFLRESPLQITRGQKAAQLIIEKKGAISIEEVLDQTGINERTLERYFKSHIGLTPKFYSRIIRFAHIFKLVQESNNNWSQLTYQAGFYDQSHFIKNFKEFTGEDPSNYGFSEKTMANFFLRE